MSYAAYQDWLKYAGDAGTEEPEALSLLSRAEGDIDTLTYNRIRGMGFERLTPFQRERVTEVVCRLARWQNTYQEQLESPLAGYSINGVSARYGETAGVFLRDGVLIPRALYRLLEQTGLCQGVAR